MIIGNQGGEHKHLWNAMTLLKGNRSKFMQQYKGAFNMGSPLPVRRVAGQQQVNDALHNFEVYVVSNVQRYGYFQAKADLPLESLMAKYDISIISEGRSGFFTDIEHVDQGGTAMQSNLKGITLEGLPAEIVLTQACPSRIFGKIGLVLVHNGISDLQTHKSIMVMPYSPANISLPLGTMLNLDDVLVSATVNRADVMYTTHPYRGYI
jgi:hypothetical protein